MHDKLSQAELSDLDPRLDRARELFIALFEDRSPLVNLGYSLRQQDYTIPVLRLMETDGTGLEDEARSWLGWHHPKDEGIYLSLSQDSDSPSSSLIGWRKPFVPDHVPRELKSFYLALNKDKTVEVLGAYRVIDVAMIDERGEADVDDLGQLVPLIYQVRRVRFYRRLSQQTPITELGRRVGLVTTFEAAWVDDYHRLEFAVKVQRASKPAHYELWRRLTPVSDEQGSVTLFGQKANVSQKSVSDTLAQKEERVSGNLAFDVA